MQAKRASVLILALWILSFLAVFAVGLGYNVSGQLRLAAYFQDRVKTYALAYAGIERALIELTFDQTPEYDSFSDAWLNNAELFQEMPLGEGFVSLGGQNLIYGLVDESNKINLNRASVEILKTLLENAGAVETEEASDIANSIIDWRDADVIVSPGGAEDTFYANQKFPYPCKDKNFEVAEELLLVKGITPEIFTKIAPFITVYGGGQVNLNTVQAGLLKALGVSESLAERIVEYRQGTDKIEGNDDDTIFKSVGDIGNIGSLFTQEAEEINKLIGLNAFTVKSDVFRIVSSGILRKGSQDVKRDIVCIVQRQGKEMPKILYWHEQ